MNLAPSMGAASAFVSGGEAAGGLAWASAPEIISALSAADIISVLSIVASKRLRSVKESDGSLLLIINSPARPAFRRSGTPPCACEGVAQCKLHSLVHADRNARPRRGMQ